MFGFLKGMFRTGKTPKAPAKGAAKAAPTPERARLLEQAMEIHRSKRKIFHGLSPEDRAKLIAMAILTLGDKPKGKT